MNFEDRLRDELGSLATLAPEPRAQLDADAGVLQLAPMVETPHHRRRYALAGLSAAAAVALVVGIFALPDHGSVQKIASTTTLAPCTPEAAVATVHVVALASLKFDRTEYGSVAGCITIDYGGAAGHTLVITPAVEGATRLYSDPSGPMSGTWRFAPGTYTLYCDIAGHREAGMEATLIVAGPPAAGTTTTTVATPTHTTG